MRLETVQRIHGYLGGHHIVLLVTIYTLHAHRAIRYLHKLWEVVSTDGSTSYPSSSASVRVLSRKEITFEFSIVAGFAWRVRTTSAPCPNRGVVL